MEWKESLIRIIQLLLKNKADPNKVTQQAERSSDYRYNCHPLALAYFFDLFDIFRLLLDYGSLLPLSDLRWVDPCGDFTAYGYVMNLLGKQIIDLYPSINAKISFPPLYEDAISLSRMIAF